MSTQVPIDHTAKYLAPNKLTWPEKEGFRCAKCNEPIRANPYVPDILGCPKCNTTVKPAGYDKFFKTV